MTMISKIQHVAEGMGPLLGLAGSANVRTPCGARRVENLRPGDLIVTRDNGLCPVRMVWSRTVTSADLAADPSLAPVRLRPRAIGPMMPMRDLILAPDHRILVPGYRLADVPDTQSCLLAARDIALASDAAWIDKTPVDMVFYNIVFDEHQVFAANGLPVESYLPRERDLSRLDEKVRSNLTELFDLGGQTRPFPAQRYNPPEAPDFRPEFV